MLKTLAINDLNNLLADLFCNVRNLEGEFYSKTAIIFFVACFCKLLLDEDKI
jgi:hypothetical protein